MTTSSGPASRAATQALRASLSALAAGVGVGVGVGVSAAPPGLLLEFECASLASRACLRSALRGVGSGGGKGQEVVRVGEALELRVRLAAAVMALVDTDPHAFEFAGLRDFEGVVGEVRDWYRDRHEGADLPLDMSEAFAELMAALRVQACLAFFFSFPEGSKEGVEAMRQCMDRLFVSSDLRAVEKRIVRVMYGRDQVPPASHREVRFNVAAMIAFVEAYDFEQVFSFAKLFARALQGFVLGPPRLVHVAESVGASAPESKKARVMDTTASSSSSSSAAAAATSPHPAPKPKSTTTAATTTTSTTASIPAQPPAAPPPKPAVVLTGRIKFSAAEEEALRQGVAKHGEGKWGVILDEYQAVFTSQKARTAVDLKDKWRNMKRLLG